MDRAGLSQNQLNKLADFLFDLSKLTIASVVVGFFVPADAGLGIDLGIFVFGSLVAIGLLSWGVVITPNQNIT